MNSNIVLNIIFIICCAILCISALVSDIRREDTEHTNKLLKEVCQNQQRQIVCYKSLNESYEVIIDLFKGNITKEEAEDKIHIIKEVFDKKYETFGGTLKND